MSLGELILIYQMFAKSENKSDRTIEATTEDVREYIRFLGGDKLPQDITSIDFREFLIQLQTRPKRTRYPGHSNPTGLLSSESVAHKARSVRAFWSWMFREEFITANPLARIKPPKIIKKTVVPPTPQEVSRIIELIPRQEFEGNRDRTIALTLYGTALRLSEALNLRVQDVNFNTGQMIALGKGGKERSLFMSPKVFKALFKYYSRWRPDSTSDLLFIHANGRKLTRFYYEHRFQTFVKSSCLDKHCTPHSLRYAYALEFLRNGGDPFVLQNILGHSTIDMTQKYVKLANTDVEKSMKALSPAEQLDVHI